MINITASLRQNELPAWAHLERKLIDAMNETLEPTMAKYLHPDGRFLWPYDEDSFQNIDGLDDAYESFHSWPLFYLAGGDAKFLSASHREFDVITEQFSHYPTGHGHPMVVKEYEQGYDWMHQGEGYQFFYLLNLADPTNEKNRERSFRFAGFYLNEDTDIEPLYDPELKMLKCCYVGSMGPAHRNFTDGPWGYAEYKQLYGLPFHDVPGVVTVEDLKDETNALAMGKAMKERLQYGDTAINLFATSMVMNAYLHSGDAKYRNWINEYTGAWRQRTAENGGIVPDNVGPSGVVGERVGGRWYGGYYGWTWPHGFLFVMEAVITAAQNSCLINQNDDMKWPRELLRKIADRGIVRDGTLHVPQKYADPGSVQEYKLHDRFLKDSDTPKVSDRDDFEVLLVKDGWYEFQPLSSGYSAHILQMSHDNKDMEQAKRLRNNTTNSFREITHFYAKNQGGHDDAWLTYLDGGFPDYPEKILEHNLFQVSERMMAMENDTRHPSTYNNAYLQEGNPITGEGLVQLTMGGPLPLYNGGLLQVSVRYFDGQKKRPGLPEGISALVSKIAQNSVKLTLVNTRADDEQELAIQAGTYGEHKFTTVTWCEFGRESEVVQINNKYIYLKLLPESIVELNAEIERFAYVPSYKEPYE